MQRSENALTSKGAKWELLHSLWIVVTFTLYFGWVAFIYIGLMSRQRRWVLWGLFYSIPLILELFTSFTNLWPAANEYTWQGYLVAAVIGIIGVAPIFHAFKVRREYLIRLQMLSEMPSRGPATSRGKRWELLHSLWIGWTFTLGLFSWIAFAYIGFRARHPRWILWAVFYAVPFVLFMVLGNLQPSGDWVRLVVIAFLAASLVVSVIHAFLVRKEYLLRLDLLQRERSNVSVTSRGKRWELLHSLWIGWTFTLGLFSWISFIYIGIRAGRTRWILWGLLYSVAFIGIMVATQTTAPGSGPAVTVILLVTIAGFVSIGHAFLVRNDYLVRLENRMQEIAETDAVVRRSSPSDPKAFPPFLDTYSTGLLAEPLTR